MFTVPTILKMLVEHPAAGRHDHSSLRSVIYAGAPMYREDQKRALAVLGPVIVQYFGLGEVTGNITVLPPALHDPEDGPNARIGTCGFERTGMQVSIQDDNGRELKPHETGEICVIGPGVFAGYYDNPEANAKAFRDGWFRTGDLGHVDEEGFVYITGRASDMYISGGSNIYPREVEEKILTHPAVGEVAVLALPHVAPGLSDRAGDPLLLRCREVAGHHLLDELDVVTEVVADAVPVDDERSAGGYLGDAVANFVADVVIHRCDARAASAFFNPLCGALPVARVGR